jgi:tetratricopeptide (TPR) repeat protein
MNSPARQIRPLQAAALALLVSIASALTAPAHGQSGEIARPAAERGASSTAHVIRDAQPASAETGQAARAKVLFDQALELQRGGQYPQAIERYQEVLGIEPKSAPTLNNLGRVHEALGETDKALDYYQRAVKVAKDNQTFYQKQYADLLWKTKREKEAVSQYEAIALQMPQLTQAHDAVVDYYLQSEQRDPDAFMAYLWRLVEEGEVITASDAALAALASGKGGNDAQELLTVTTQTLSYDTLSQEQSVHILDQLARLKDHPDIGPGVTELLALYQSPTGDFSWWARKGSPRNDPKHGVWPRDAFRAVARSLGREAEIRGAPDRAEAYYFAAAELSQDELDPQAFQALSKLYTRQKKIAKLESLVSKQKYIDRLFSQKNAAYRRGQLDKIYEYHVTLGYIYGTLAKQDQKWWGDSHTPTSAVFQLEHALMIGKTIDQKDRGTANRPQAHVDVGVVELLADYYDRKEPLKANELRVQSAARLEKAGESAAAQQVMRFLHMKPLPPPELE